MKKKMPIPNRGILDALYSVGADAILDKENFDIPEKDKCTKCRKLKYECKKHEEKE